MLGWGWRSPTGDREAEFVNSHHPWEKVYGLMGRHMGYETTNANELSEERWRTMSQSLSHLSPKG